MPEIIDNIKVGLKIKELLKEHNMTQEDLANELFISKSAVSQNLNGKSSFDIQNLLKIAKLFNISLEELLAQKSTKSEDIISEYERLVLSGLDKVKKVDSSSLNIKEPDIYGKVFIEYVIEYKKSDIFSFLHQENMEWVNDFYLHSSAIYLDIIRFVLLNKLDGVTRYIEKYVGINGSFHIECKETEEEVWKLIDQLEESKITEILSIKVFRNVECLKIFSVKKPFNLHTSNELLMIISKYQLNNVFTSYIKMINLLDNFYQTVEIFALNAYIPGLHILIDNLEINDYNEYTLKRIKAQDSINYCLMTGDLSLLEKFLAKKIFLDLTLLAIKAISTQRIDAFYFLINRFNDELNYRKIGFKVIKISNLELLSNIINKLSPDDLDYLLAWSNLESIEIMKYLISHGAKFNIKYYNHSTYQKINIIINNLLGDK